MVPLLPYYHSTLIEAGCDEAGIGAAAGPIVVAAVIFDKKYKNESIKDSKVLSERKRTTIANQIKDDAIAWSVAFASNELIDTINPFNASYIAYEEAISTLSHCPQLLLVDGNRFKAQNYRQHICIVRGDQKYLSIAAASILAKTTRDEYMKEKANLFPQYHWDQNKGYLTKKHISTIRSFGFSPLHRQSYKIKALS